MRLDGLLSPLKNSREFTYLLNDIEKEKYPIGVFGLSESGRSYLIKGVYDKLDKPFLIVAHSDVEARKLYEDLNFYVPDVYYFPVREVAFYNIDAISGDLRWERLKVIKQMLSKSKKIIVTCIEALASSYIPPKLYEKYTFKLTVGGAIDFHDMSEMLVQSGYERAQLVENKGQFSIRGGIMDIYPPISAQPFRIELFGDEIDSIRTFNVETQRSIDKINSVEIFPAKEIILSKENIETGSIRIQKDLDIVINNHKTKKDREIVKKIQQIISANLESLNENWSFETIDSFIPYFYDKTANLLDYMENAFIVVDEAARCSGKLDSVYFEFEENYKSFLQMGSILPQQAKLLIERNAIFELLGANKILTLDSLTRSNKILAPSSIVNFANISLQSYNGHFDMLIEDIKQKKSHGYKIVILSGTRPRGERLAETLRDKGIESCYKDVIAEIQNGEIIITFGNQLNGFEYPDLKLCVISDKEVFGQAKRKAQGKNPNKKGVSKIKSFSELKPGDYVVHVNHGIGIYKGIKQLEVQGHTKDYLELGYHAEDKLFVPVEQLDMVQKYIGSEGKPPRVNKLGSAEWSKIKRKVKKSIEDVAQDLVKLYAIRSTLKGYRFSSDKIWQKQFEEEFPFEETVDQLSAIEDIKGDMESDKVMDRLLCGDVGYGKTEVAIRAAFKAVMDGKQAALLVPTTILAQQHYNNFVQRFSDFPVNVDVISRFRSKVEQKATLKAVKEGNVDILIGTHRILQADVMFKDLGLLVIDEEQRFGVSHKEKIKKLKKNVDVLTLSATPIPRTLHMSLIGVRDISVIETPPAERYPVQTYVVEYNDQLIRDAILREINRGGQVYFVYNRVENIQEIALYISNLVPEGKVAVAHGQMNEKELENVMVEFMRGESNILIATTIIETGMDIPNVNTMVIFDSDKMGLSQLYQLRGRVGRTNRLAYCYLTYKKDKVITEIAEKRLKAIKDFTELGSGFKIALKDLEIRGAGNMMGSAQHGHMAAVGYDLYCRMLQDTIRLVKGEIDKEPVDTLVELKVDAYIPSKYINDEVQKIEVYKKISAIESFDDMLDIQEELIDRFSDVPESVNNLIKIAYIRSIGKALGVEKINETKDEIVIAFESKDRINDEIITGLLKKYNKRISFKVGEKPAIGYKLKFIEREKLLDYIKEIMEFIHKM